MSNCDIKAQCGIGALFKLQVYKADTNELVRETPIFRNLVLNQGFEKFVRYYYKSTGNFGYYKCFVGTGNSTPIAEQTKLDNQVAVTDWRIGYSTVLNNTASNVVPNQICDDFYHGVRSTFRFNTGAINNTVREVGITWNYDGLFNRALIKDAEGNPTGIEVGADEFLDVTVEIRLYPIKITTGQFNLLDSKGNVRSAHDYTITLGNFQADDYWWMSFYDLPHFYNEQWKDLGSPGNMSQNRNGNKCINRTSLALNSQNGTHKYIKDTLYLFNHKTEATIELTPPIVKTNTMEMGYTFSISVDRYTPPETA